MKVKKGKGNILEIVWFFLSKYKFNFLFLIVLAIISGILETLNVSLIYPILSSSLEVQTTSNPFLNFVNIFAKLIPIDDTLIRYCVLFIVLACLVYVLKLFYTFLTARFTSLIVTKAKQNVFDKYVNSDYQFFIDNKQGEIFYKIVGAPLHIARLLIILLDSTMELILSVSIFALLFSISLKSTAFIGIAVIGYYYLTKRLSLKVSYRAGRKKLESVKAESVIINEYTTGFKQIKVFNTASYWKDLYDGAIYKYWKYYRENYFWQGLPGLTMMLLLYLSVGAVVIFIKLQYPSDFISIMPVLGTFVFAVFMILPKLSKFGAYRMEFMHILPDVETVFDILKDTSYNKIKNGDRKFLNLNSDISLKNVNFAHKNREMLLNNISLELKRDRITALVGPSGSGKSTIVSLLLRLHEVEDGGGVYIDNINIKEYDLFSFLEKIGFVSQDTFIYNASVRDNIAFGSDYTEQEVLEAAKLANADAFIQQMPEKYDTLVGDQGVRLSGGEKQRIAIARAMIRKPEILILDEATSSLDNVSESIVQEAINKVSEKCTTFIIAHRLSTIQNADVIYVIDKGKIVESGTHNQLLDKKGKYWELYNIQSTNNANV